MGIKGLHVLLKSIQKPCSLQKFSGQTLGVDAYVWLHRGLFAGGIDLALDRPTTKHIEFVLSKVQMLIHFGVRPYLVFDGDKLPSKAGTEADRERKRQESKALGQELLRTGRTTEAYQELQKSIDVTPYMARQLIEDLKRLEVQYVVAPYEADAQLVYLEQQGIINGIISEDSDLLVFGAKILLSKLDQYGQCVEINRANFSACRDVSFIGWTDADFRRMCILSGCDYLPNIPKIGLKKAHRSIHRFRSVKKAVRMLQLEGNFHVPAGYLEEFKQAELTFLYQRVFCPKEGKLVPLTPPGPDVNLEDLAFIGKDVEPKIAVGVAQGDLDPTTKQPITLRPALPKEAKAGIIRRQTLGSSGELKPCKPITSFFSPKRTPLAELDPNSLTPSPSQQRLLERHANSSWDASHAPATSALVRPRVSVPLVPSTSSPLVRSAERTSFLAHASRLSNTTQPIKRQRLCSETEEDSPCRSDLKSRFFTEKSQACTSTGPKIDRSKKPRCTHKSSLDIFSDDQLAEDIMSQLVGPLRQNGDSEVSMSLSTDSKQIVQTTTESESSCSPKESAKPPQESSVADEGWRTVGRSTESTDEKSISAESNPEVFQQVLEYHIKKQNSTLFSKYTYQAGAGDSNRHSQSSAKPHTPTVYGVQAASATHSLTMMHRIRAQTSRGERLTPLQRLGQSALARSRTINDFPTTARTSCPGLDLRNQTDGLVKGLAESIGTLVTRGSEDQIVLDSDEEDDPSGVETR